MVDVNGLRGFIPLSRLSPDRLQALDRQENQTGQPIAAKIIQVSTGILHLAPAAGMVDLLLETGQRSQLGQMASNCSLHSPAQPQFRPLIR